jgi:DNA-binding transcriptional LysR family regulator
LSLSDLGEMLFLPPLAQALRSQSPGSQISNVAVAALEVSAALEAHEIDLAIGILDSGHSSTTSELLFQENFVAITANRWRPVGGHAGGTLKAGQLASSSLAVASPAATFHGGVDLMLSKLKLNERIVLRTRHYGSLPELVTRTDLLAIVPLMFANSLAPRYDVRIWELPRHGSSYEVQMVWHRSAGMDLAHSWLRGVVRNLFQRTPTGSA